jgi:hypothetical protein
MFITHVFCNYTANIEIILVPCNAWYLKNSKLHLIFYNKQDSDTFLPQMSIQKSVLADLISDVTTTISETIKTTTVIAKTKCRVI